MAAEKQLKRSLNRLSTLFLRPSNPTTPTTEYPPTPESTSTEEPIPSPPAKVSTFKKTRKLIGKMSDNNPFRQSGQGIPSPGFATQQQQYTNAANWTPPTESNPYQAYPGHGLQSTGSSGNLLQVPQRPPQQRQRSASSSNVPTLNNNNPFMQKPLPIPGRLQKHSANKSHSNLTQLYKAETQNYPPRDSSLGQQGHQRAVSHSLTPPPGLTPPAPAPNAKVEQDYNFVNAKGQPLTEAKHKKKKSFFGGSKEITKSSNLAVGPAAWIVGQTEKVPYDLALLASGVKVPELWNERGDTLIYLFPPQAGKGPSFRINSASFAASMPLKALTVQSNIAGSAGHRRSSSLVEIHIPIELQNPMANPLTPTDIQTLIRVRNLFAFLIGQSLIATPTTPTIFEVFLHIATLLETYGFSDGADDVTFGEIANNSFSSYVNELELLDMRTSVEKTIDCLILGERMKSELLWGEAFVHGVGKYSDIQQQFPDKFAALSPQAVQRLERATLDLEKRVLRIRDRLTDFDFPSVFSGLLNSRTAEVREVTRFEAWKSAFLATRKFFLQHLKSQHGSWPPKKQKNSNVPALNRLVLRDLGYGLAMLYDLMADRKHPSSRLTIYGKNFPAHPDRRVEALRQVLAEYDFSGSPTYPIMPFDAPLLPSLSDNDADEFLDSDKKQKKVGKNELQFVLAKSYNKDTFESHLPFVDLFHLFEKKSTTGMSIDRVVDFRLGAWLFVYCVLQALPMLTVDAPTVKFSEGVEYFLCQPVRGRVHWSKDSSVQLEWFRDPVTGNITQMSKDVVELGIEAMYRMSHCWRVGVIWEHELTTIPSAHLSSSPPRSGAGSRHSSVPRVSNARLSGPHQRHASRGSNPSAHGSPALLPNNQFSPPILQNSNWVGQGAANNSSFQTVPSFDRFSLEAAENYHANNASLLEIPTPPPAIEDPASFSAHSRHHSGSRSRHSSPYAGAGADRRASMLMMGLERVSVPSHGGPQSAGMSPRLPSDGDISAGAGDGNSPGGKATSMTFEDILASQEGASKGKKHRGRQLSRNILGGGS